MRATLPHSLENAAAVIAHDLEFHALLGRSAAIGALEFACGSAGILLFCASKDFTGSLPAARHGLAQAHQAITTAVLAGDAQTAKDWMRRHIADFRCGYEIAGFDTLQVIDIKKGDVEDNPVLSSTAGEAGM